MTFYIAERYYNVQGRQVRFIHNIFTGSKQIYIDGFMTKSLSMDFAGRCVVQRINITGTNHDIVITPNWLTYSYCVAPKQREYGYGLLDDVMLDEALL